MPAIPSWTVEGAFGIARTTGISPARWRSIVAVGMAAATESTVCSGDTWPVSSSSSVSMSCGFTDTTINPAPSIASAFESVTGTP